MTIEQIQAAATRNYARMMAQVTRLATVRHHAKTAAHALRSRRDGAREAEQGIALMQSLRHVPNFFPTPRDLAMDMIQRAAIGPGMLVLEPSAGKGNIAVQLRQQGIKVVCIEINHTLAEYLRGHGFEVQCRDFLEYSGGTYDRVIMNPPFERGEDIKHIQHAFDLLNPGGRLVSVACSSTGIKLDRWVADYGGMVEPLPSGTFAVSERPTQVNTCLITLDK